MNSNLMEIILLFFMCLCNTNGQDTIKIGTNVDGVVDWSRTHAFVDIVKQSRAIGTPDRPQDPIKNLDPNGWPLGDFGIILSTDDSLTLNGTYIMYFEADSIPTILFGGKTPNITNLVYDPLSKIVTAEIYVPQTATIFALSFKNTTNGVRNLKIIRPGYDPVNPPLFTTPFLNLLSQFDSLRFMDWGYMNQGNPITNWSDRPTPNNVTMTTSYGVCLEYMIALSNQLNKDMWVNVPHLANDDFVYNMALLIKSQLNSNLNIYVEYSNELWNYGYGFPQSKWNLNQSIIECTNTTIPCDLNYDGINNNGYWAWRRPARRIVQISNIFRSVFGDDAMITRVRPILAGQMIYSEGIKTGLKYIFDQYGPVNNFIYAIAGAPYFNLGSIDNYNNLTATDVLNTLQKNANSLKYDPGMIDYAAQAAWHNIRVLAYEGGPDTYGPNNIQAKKNATLDSATEALIIGYLNDWYGKGFDTFFWFTSGARTYDSGSGTFALTNNMNNQNTPKIRALNALMSKPKPDLFIGEPVPWFIDGRKFINYNRTAWQSLSYPRKSQNQFINYLLASNTSSNYYITVNVSTTSASVIQIQVNNNATNIINLQNTNNIAVPQQYVIAYLRSGLNNLNLTINNGQCVIYNLILSVDQPLPIIISPLILNFIATLPISYQIIAINNPTNFSVDSLPNDLYLDSNTGLISGTTTSFGVFNVTITASNSGGSTSSTIKLNIRSACLLQESFQYEETCLFNKTSGIGFSAPWDVQSSFTLYYLINSTIPLTYGNLLTLGNYSSGGGLYLSAGRKIDVSNAFYGYADPVNTTLVGLDGTTLYWSVLMMKYKNDDDPCYVSLHPHVNTDWLMDRPERISIGYFSDSKVNGTQYWSIKSGNLQSVLSTKPIILNQTVFLVVQMNFGYGINNDSALFYVNPSLEDNQPVLPDAQIQNVTIQFKNLGYYGGNRNTGESAIDEIRVGISWDSVTPKVLI